MIEDGLYFRPASALAVGAQPNLALREIAAQL
jgi:hypothetical protein